MTSLVQLTSITEISDCERIVLYPAASGAYYFLGFLEKAYPELREKVIALGDRDLRRRGLTFEELPIVGPNDLAELRPDVIVVNSILYFDEIATLLHTLLAKECRIIDANRIAEFLSESSSGSRLAQNCPCSVNNQDLEAAIAGLSPWYLSMPFGSSRFAESEKGAFTFELLDRMELPASLAGKRVLDVGASDGFYSFECEQRGASDVLAIDKPAWTRPGGLERFLTAKKLYRSNVRHEILSVEELEVLEEPQFDLILALGIYYHLKDPYLAFRKFFSMTTDMLIVSGRTVSVPFENPFNEGQEAPYMILNLPNQGKWIANVCGLTTMLESAGFSKVEVCFDLTPPGGFVGSTVVRARK